MDRQCIHSRCDKDVKHRGLCEKHYRELLNKTKQRKPIGRPPIMGNCKICDQKHYSKGYCMKHYNKARYLGKI